ncbi:phosphatidylinositol phosphatase PTPRQ isoform X2 [Tachysurus fulvidraco]|uniref:phosphatidylinositol phosphatase PTPRQ isoform X2 n=1 Tax=Tachysurus fulvidraco TaxID=1234273 RepID=UPI001FF040E4|nr:phosphatidylinositol phosphatase PTPRQ isoform X2 [Tachysurus fulvidraco]
MGKTVPLRLLGFLMQVVNLPGLGVLTSVHVQLEFCSFPLSLETDSYTLLWENKVLSSSVVCQSVCKCIMDVHVPQSSPELNLTLQSYKQEQMSEARFFQLIPLQSSFLKVEVSSTSAVLNWTDWTSEQIQHVCVGAQCWALDSSQPSCLVSGLQPGTRYMVTVVQKTRVPQVNVTLTQKVQLAIETARCPVGWIATGWNCFQIRQDVRTWPEAQRACESNAPGVHLASVKTHTDFLSVSEKLQSHNHLLLLWTSLNDRGEEGRLRWADGSAYNLSVAVISSLSANQTDCFALQRNATGPGYFFTSLLCDVQLPYICHTPLVQGSFSGLCMDNVQETEAEFTWSGFSQLLSALGSVLSLHVHDQSGRRILTHTPREHTLNRKCVHGLFAGNIYYVSLSLTHPSEASQTLGTVFIVKTRPNPPKNITVTGVTSSQIALSWSAPDFTHDALFEQYFLSWLDVASGRGRGLWLNRTNLSTVIGGLEAYHVYQIILVSVTAEGVESAETTPLVVITEVNPPHSISVSALGTENVSVCWEQLRDDEVDAFHIQLRTHTPSQESYREFWVNNSHCITLTNLIPGETYDVGVATERGGNRSLEKTLQLTLKPQKVLDAVPYAVDMDSVVLFVQMPRSGVYDGLAVTYSRISTWIPISSRSSTRKAVVGNLSAGTVYEFQLFVTSRGVSSDAFTVLPVRTCLAPPVRVRAGVVTDHSVEVLWDRAQGHELTYEVLCMDCTDNVMVQKVTQTRAVFHGVIAGKLCNISVRTEKETFRDSAPVFLTIRPLPSSVTLEPVCRTSSSLCVSWREGPGVCNAFMLSIKNSTYTLQMRLSVSDESVYTAVPAPPDTISFIEQEGKAMYVTWTRPLGQVTGYRVFYALSTDTSLRHRVIVHGNHVKITDLIPGSDYEFEIQSFLREDFSQSVSKNVSTSPAGVCSLSLFHSNSSSVTLAWDVAVGHFDFHRVTVSNDSHRWMDGVGADAQKYTASGLRDGCSYNISVERVRNRRQSGTAATLTVHTVPAIPEDVCVTSVTPRSFSLNWVPSSGCDQRYFVHLTPDHGNVTIITTADGHVQANVTSVTQGTQYTVTVSAVASSGMRSAVSRSITTMESVPAAPFKPEGERVGSNGILLSWKMPPPPDLSIDSFVIRYKEMCPHLDSIFTEVTKSLDIPETLLNTLSPGATYNIKVAAVNKAGVGPFSQSLYFKTAEAPPGMVTNLTAFAQNHSSVVVKWFLPVRINGLITKFAVKAKHARTGQVVRTLELNAEEIMKGALPHCNDAADFLSRGTPSPSITAVTSALPPLTMSAIPSASIWNVPITVGMDMLRPYTAYVFEVSAFTSDGEGQITSTMVRMPEAAPEDPPQTLSLWNITSKSFSLSWESPTIITGRFSYVVQLHGPAGLISENSTSEQTIVYTGLTPFTSYHIIIMAKSAGATGPAAETRILTPSEAPSAVSYLRAEAVDSMSVRLSWGIPNQPNGLITRYRVLVLHQEMLVQDITLRALQQNASQNGASAGSDPGLILSSVQPRPSTRAAITGLTPQSRDFTQTAVTSRIEVLPPTEELVNLSSNHISYTVTRLSPFTDYNFSVSAFTTVGEGPATLIAQKTQEQVPSSVQDVSYENISSTSIFVSWNPPLNPNGKITHYTVYILNLHSHEARQRVTNTTSIVLTGLDKYTQYKVRVAAWTAAGESPVSDEDNISVLTPEDEPDSPPHTLELLNTTSSTATITWSPPDKPNGIIIFYEVTYSNSTFSYTVNSNAPSVTLRHLKPYTLYNVTARGYTRLGHGNKTSPTLQMLSGEDVPGSPPYGLSYDSISSSEVNVSWSPPLVPNGVILYYSVEYWNITHTLNITTHTPSVLLSNLRKYARYRLSVQAATRVGLGNHSSEILNITTLEDVPSSPPQSLYYRKLSDNQVELSWKPPEDANSEILYYVVRVWNQSSEFVTNVTKTSVVVSVDGPGYYNASVSSWTRLGDGGVLIYITFSTSESVPSDPPQNVFYTLLSPRSVRLSWSPPTQPNGIIQYYTIYYSDNITISTQRVPGLVQWVQLDRLRAGHEYRVWLSSSTSLGDGGVISDPLNFTTPEDVPSDTVHNLSAQLYGSTAVVISWDPPLEPNGRVFYQLSLQEAGITHPSINRTENQTITKTTTDTIFLFTKLRKYFPYVLQVTPATSAGPALDHTSVLHLRTDDDVPSSAPLLSVSRNLSSTSILVSWYAPVEPNGEIIEYTLVLQGPRGSNSTYTSNSELILTHLTPYTAYNLSISAVNRKGMGPSLMLPLHTDEAGPMSPPRNLSIFNHSSDSVWLHWEPSLEPNGVIQHYGFKIVELNTDAVIYQNSTGASTQAELHGFKPHSSYEISVSTYTRAGNGDQYSLPVTFTTLESVSEAVGNLSCSGLDWDSVYMEWKPPENPNGEILLYHVVSARRRDEVFPLVLPDKLVYTFSGLLPDTLYVISVAAVNSAGLGEEANCTAQTLPESVPDPPESLSVVNLSSDAVSLSWLRPARVPGHLRGYRVHRQRLALVCEMEDVASCVESEVFLWVNVTENGSREVIVTLQPLLKYRRYRVRVVAWTNAGAGKPTDWMHIHTLAGNPDAPPVAVSAVPSISGLKITWDEPPIISGPTSYLVDIIDLAGSGRNVTVVRNAGEIRMVVIGNLTAYTYYLVTVTAFTGDVADARRDGMTSEPVTVRTLEGEPKDPPKNVTVVIGPEEVTRVYVTFLPPDEPNGNISAYHVYIYRDGQLNFEINSLPVVSNPNKTMTAVIHGLKGGFNYSIQIAAVNGAGFGPRSEVRLSMPIKAPPMPSKRPTVALNHVGAVMATSQTITIEMPLCFFSDDNGPIHKIQVIVSEPAVMDYSNVSNWKSVFLHSTAPYVTDEGFPNPECSVDVNSDEDTLRRKVQARMYVIGAEEGCFSEEAQILCNGPLKPKTYYVFKFRATNIIGQYTDSMYSERVRTADDGLLTRDEQIILGVLLSFFLALFLILIIYASVRIHQRQKEGGTYSPREAEIIETKLKLDQLIAMADMELKEEKIQRPISKKAFIQHVEDLCANDNAKFHEEFAELPKLLHDLATSDADLPWNRSKNRFTNIKPYNNNRVKLLSEPGIPGSDYINASFVSGYLCPNEFIATQGPLPGTVADFWRMIWETRTKTVVMLTQCFEKGRIRCHQYWPEDNKPVTVFGDIIITKLTEDVHPDWTVRALRVEKHGDYMVVHHFNYTSWPEHGVPESSSTLIQFVKAVRSNRGNDNTTIAVHCSAGVGRTGVFIALDHLIQHVRDHDFVDVYGLVAELRSERMCMVQNLAQYMFLYQSTLDLLTSKGNSQSIWFVNYSALEKMDSLDAMEGDVELEWEETTM